MNGCVVYNECLEVHALSFKGMRDQRRFANMNENYDETPQREFEYIF